MTTQTSIPALSSAKLYFISGKRTKVVAVYPWTCVKGRSYRELEVHDLSDKLYFTEGLSLEDRHGLGFPKDRSIKLQSKYEKGDPLKNILGDLGFLIEEEYKDDMPDLASLLDQLKENPDDLTALRFLYCIYCNGLKGVRQDYVQAKNNLERIFSINPQDRDVFEELIGMYVLEKYQIVRDIARARDLLEPVLEKNPIDGFALGILCNIYLRGANGVKRNPARAVTFLEHALDKNPTNSFALNKLADIYVNGSYDGTLRDPSKLLPHLLRALAIDPVHSCITEWFYSVCRECKELLLLVDILEKALKVNPSHDRILNFLVDIYFWGKDDLKADPEKGIILLEAAVQHDPALREALERLLEIYFDGSYKAFERDVPRAMQYLEKAVEKKPADRYVLPTAVWLYFAIGENDKALAYLHRVLACEPENHFAKKLLKNVEEVGIDAFTKDLPTMIEYLKKASGRSGLYSCTIRHLKNLQEK